MDDHAAQAHPRLARTAGAAPGNAGSCEVATPGIAVTLHEPVLQPHLVRPACGVWVISGWLLRRARGPPPPAAQPPVLPLGRRRVTAAN